MSRYRCHSITGCVFKFLVLSKQDTFFYFDQCIYLTWSTGFCSLFPPSLCFSNKATKKPCVRVFVVLARRHWVSGSRPRSGHSESRGTTLEDENISNESVFIRGGLTADVLKLAECLELNIPNICKKHQNCCYLNPGFCCRQAATTSSFSWLWMEQVE